MAQSVSTGQSTSNKNVRPSLNFWQIWNMSFGFLGIQMGFALQNANASRMLQNFGADVHTLSWFWLVAPLTGMIVQPIVGKSSDKTWNKLGRRRPYFLAGAILSALAMLLLPRADLFVAFMPAVLVGAGFLMIMDASFNIAMEPFRALVADKLPANQRSLGFSVQTGLIGIGAVIGSWLPYALGNWFGVAKEAAEGSVAPNVVMSFVIGALGLLGAIIWTIIKTPEYPPEVHEGFASAEAGDEGAEEEETSILQDFMNMPKTMKQLGLVQFFSWFGLFSMWVFSTPAIAHQVWGWDLVDTHAASYNEAGDWVGVIFGIYNFVAMIVAFFLPTVAKAIGRRMTHAICLAIGGIGLISIMFIHDKNALIFSMVCVGIAWASILAMPYAILSGSLNIRKIGVYMGIFNFFITFPQLVNGVFGGPIVKYVFGGNPVYSLVMGGVCFILGAIAVMRVDDPDEAEEMAAGA